MPESAAHARLVRTILEFINRNFAPLSEIAVRDDSSSPVRGERPPLISGFVPDVYAVNVPTTMTIIGEAKTRRDLETTHSQAQIIAFIQYLSTLSDGVFVLSVPLVAGAATRRTIEAANRVIPSPSTRIFILDGIA